METAGTELDGGEFTLLDFIIWFSTLFFRKVEFYSDFATFFAPRPHRFVSRSDDVLLFRALRPTRSPGAMIRSSKSRLKKVDAVSTEQ